MSFSKDKYLSFCKKEKGVPIFSLPWWLDIVCGKDNWDVILIEKGNEVIATFPYYFRKHGMLNFYSIEMPILTQKLGPFIKYPLKQGYTSKLSFEKEVMQKIIDLLPKYDTFNVHFDYVFSNWLPFYWRGFQQTTRYTYLIKDLTSEDSIFNSFSSNKKTDIRKAEKNAIVKYDLDCEKFIEFYIAALKKKGQNLAYPKAILRELILKAYLKKNGRIIYSVGVNNPDQILGAIFFVWDYKSVYSLVTAFDISHNNIASSSLLFYQIMKDFKNSGLIFDFEGSMVEQIERSYNKFGTIQVPYFRISKINSRKGRIYNLLLELRNEFRN